LAHLISQQFLQVVYNGKILQINIPNHQDETTEQQMDTVLQFSWLTGQDIPFP
jgi:hypothetical protein